MFEESPSALHLESKLNHSWHRSDICFISHTFCDRQLYMWHCSRKLYISRKRLQAIFLHWNEHCHNVRRKTVNTAALFHLAAPHTALKNSYVVLYRSTLQSTFIITFYHVCQKKAATQLPQGLCS